MRIPINLSSEPFRRDRPIVAAYAACAIALTVLLAGLIFLILGERHRARDARQSVVRVNAQLRTLVSDQAKIDAFLRQPPNAQVLQRSLLLNELIQRKSISWTRIFADLEDVLPYNVRIVSVRLPQVTSRNEVVLDMNIGVSEPVAVYPFFKNLEASPKFGTLNVHSSTPPSQNDKFYRYRVTVNYAQKL
jgi:type IV pilus assembly protein PilN